MCQMLQIHVTYVYMSTCVTNRQNLLHVLVICNTTSLQIFDAQNMLCTVEQLQSVCVCVCVCVCVYVCVCVCACACA